MCRWSLRATQILWVLVVLPLLCIACAAPPNKEIGDAQNALKAAQAGGAEQYAPESYAEAENAYRRANQAVLAGDYRLALNYALESREHAQNAARQSADANVRARDEVQRLMADVAGLLAQTVALTEEAQRTNVSPRVVREARQSLAQLSGDVQKAGAAMAEKNYVGARPLLLGVKERLEKTNASVQRVMPAQSSKRRT
jgi:prophage DNA circulation protein